MTHLKHQYERTDLWSNIKLNNLLPVVMFFTGGIAAITIFKGQMDFVRDSINDLKYATNEYRNVEYKNAIDISNMKARLGISDEPRVKGMSTGSATLQISPKDK